MKAIHYLNQFFGQIGGEDKADYEPTIHEGTVGAAGLLNSLMKDVEITHTVICGDNFAASNTEEAIERILGFLEGKEFDLFFAGPAFLAGRYGNACGAIGKAVKERFNVPVLTSMNEENPGVELYKSEMYVFQGGRKATFMKKDLTVVAAFADKIARGERLLSAQEEGYFPRGIRHEVFLEEPTIAADRAVEMMLAKLAGKPFVTELPIPRMDRITPAPAVKDLSKVKVALVTSGGIVPSDNPDRIQSASATKWGKYDISKLDVFPVPDYKTIHAGFDPEAADTVPDRIVPLDAMRAYEKEGRFGKLHDYYYVTVGTGTTQGEAARMGSEIAQDLLSAGVQAVILTATWGTCTRCGATMAKEIERAGLPVTTMCNLLNVAKSVGNNRMVQTVSVPYPLGNPELSTEEEWKLRYHRVGVALDALTREVEEPTVFPVKI